MIKSILLPLLFLLSACDDGFGEKDPNPLHLPPQGFVGNTLKGEDLYRQNCQTCHAANGLGTHQGPPLVNDIYNPVHHADLAFHLAIKNGVRSHHWHFGDMKPIPELSPESVEHIISYIRAIQKESGIL
jgi:mono/diheme cytochrome c family protein